MKILAVDDEKLALESLVAAISEALQVMPAAFRKPKDALVYIQEHGCDIAFLDIHMRSVTGLTLAKQIKDLAPHANIIFVTGYATYSLDAFRLHASDYLLKPVTAAQIQDAMQHLRYPVKAQKHRIRLQCFGHFEVFADGTPVRFTRSKSKEILAYLTDRQGASCTMGQLMTVLWEEGPDTISRKSHLRNAISDLKQTLAAVGGEDIILKSRNSISLNCAAVECDYFDFLDAVPYAVNRYRGEYMLQYSWAEMTTASIHERQGMKLDENPVPCE